jgi:hypothetical protein
MQDGCCAHFVGRFPGKCQHVFYQQSLVTALTTSIDALMEVSGDRIIGGGV